MVLEENDPAEIAHALGVIVKARDMATVSAVQYLAGEVTREAEKGVAIQTVYELRMVRDRRCITTHDQAMYYSLHLRSLALQPSPFFRVCTRYQGFGSCLTVG